jgi:transcriptional regulator with PAS, ATPase and Fis domain
LFREDLFYRLHVVPIFIPPLRKRKNVIPKMVDHFLNQSAINFKKPKPAVKPEVIELLCRYDWPGNVRELKNLIERVFIINNDDTISLEHLPSDFLWHFSEPHRIKGLEEIRSEAEKKAILDALYRLAGDKEKTAKILNISPRILRHKIQRYNIKFERSGKPPI